MSTRKHVKVLVGERFGRLVVNKRQGSTLSGYSQWLCTCDCGTVKVVVGVNLRKGNTSSCGCYAKDATSKRRASHRGSLLPEYSIWSGMKARCVNPESNHYQWYGGRGISVCERWLNSFEAFYADMGPRPSLKHSIDRIKVNGNYEPGNCRWATSTEQNRNRRTNNLIDFNGTKVILTELAEQTGIHRTTIYHRIKQGMTGDEAVTKSIPSDKLFAMGGNTKTLIDWCSEYDINLITAKFNILKGKDIEEALDLVRYISPLR